MSEGSRFAYAVYLSNGPEDEEWVEELPIPKLAASGISHIVESRFTPGRPKLLERENAVRWAGGCSCCSAPIT